MKAIKLIALTVTLGLAVSGASYAHGNEATTTKSTTSRSPQVNHVAVPKPPASPAYAPGPVTANKTVTHSTGNGVKYTPRVIDPKESIYRKPATTK